MKRLVAFAFLIVLFHSLVVDNVFADEFRDLYRGARAQAMGNAFTAVADDEEAVFYNPAGLAGMEKFTFTFASASLDASNDLINGYPTFINALSSASISSLNTFVGKDIYARAEGTASVTIPGFEIAAIYDEQLAVRLKDLALPQGQIGGQTTYGIQAGFGVSVLKLKKKKGELRFGLAGKILTRSGGYQSPSLTQLLTLNYKQMMSGFTNTGSGFGMDTGFQFVYNMKKNITLQTGLALRDIGDTSFSSGADPILQNLAAGIALKYKGSDMKATLAYDYAHILDTAAWTKKNHLGVEFKFPLISVSAGLSQLSLCYGIGLDLWLLKLSYVSYAEDQATLSNQDAERRSMVSVAMKFEI